METIKPDIVKAAAVILNEDKNVLVVRRKDSDMWISVGGKPEIGETLEQALVREIKEETNLRVIGEPKFFHISPIEPAAGKENLTVQITSFIVEVEGEPKINPEDRIVEYHWLSREEYASGKYKLGSVLQEYLLPLLIKQGLVV